MQIKPQPQQVLEVINEAKNICLVTDNLALTDEVSAMMAFYHLFKKFKKLRLVVPEEVPASCHHLPESSVIEKDLGVRELAINFDTNGVDLEKVSYFLDGPTFKMILHPQRRSFNVERVSYEYLGHNFDLFIFFGVGQLANLVSLFNYDFNEIYAHPSINFDIQEGNEMFASLNYLDSGSSSICEMLFKMVGYWQLNFEREVSLCLLNGLVSSQSSTPRELNTVFQKTPQAKPEVRAETVMSR